MGFEGSSSVERRLVLASIPHNDVVMDLTADQQSCRVSVGSKLHAGQTVYTLYNGRNFENCPEFRIVQATCKAY